VSYSHSTVVASVIYGANEELLSRVFPF